MRFKDRLLSALAARRQAAGQNEKPPRPISRRLETNLRYLTEALADSHDFVLRELTIGKDKARVAVLFVKGLTNETTIQESVIRPLLGIKKVPMNIDMIARTVVEAGDVTLLRELEQALSAILRGRVALLLDGCTRALIIDARIYKGRNIEEPQAETTVTGPRDGFVENVTENMALLRKRLPTPHFKSKMMRLGTITQTSVIVCYVDNLVRPGLLEEVMQRLQHLQQYDLPEVLDTSYIAEAIEDHPGSPFPQTMATERPDRTVANLLEGRVCLLVDGSPKATIIPAALPDQFQSPDDYYQRPLAASILRIMRYVAAFLGTTASAIYVGILTYHYEVIPQRLIVNVAKARALVPFTSLVEALVMEAVVELVREATARLPSTAGQVIGVVGALVLGQSAVQANLVSPLLVIVIAASTIGSFAIPNNPMAISLRLLRFPLILAAGFL